MVSTLSTVVIDPPEGDMAEYERQLERLLELGAAHPLPGPRPARLRRRGRPARLPGPPGRARGEDPSTRSAEPGTLAEITARAYDDVPPPVWPVAERSGLAVLLKLAAQGRAVERDGRWRRA